MADETQVPVDDPCAILASLKAAKIAVLTGEQAKSVRYRSDTGSEREMEFQRVDIAELNRAIAQYESLCAASKGLPSRRCIIAG